MRHRVEVAADGVRVPLARRRLAEIALAVLRGERAPSTRLSITFVDARAIAALNARHLGHRGATDVISFALPAAEPEYSVHGDIYIAPEIARRNAAEHGVSAREEIVRLVVHGVLHVLGYDHPEGGARMRSRMWQRQEGLVRRLTRKPGRRRLTNHTG